MATPFVLTIDTTAPVVTWGQVLDPNAGEDMTVFYAVDEPGVESAEIMLNGGRIVPMVVAPDRLTVRLPDDAANGQAQVRAYVRDSVGNNATRTLAVMVAGVVGPAVPPPAPAGGPPMPEPERVVSPPSSARCGSRYSVRATQYGRSRARTRSRYASPGPREVPRIRRRMRALTGEDRTRVFIAGRESVRTRSDSAAHATTTVVKRPEGPDAEDELFFLGLL